MPDYSNGKIYKMTSPSGLVYIGSTTQALCERKAGHHRAFKGWIKGTLRVNNSSFRLFEEDENNIDIVLIENVDNCENKEQLHKRERYYIESIKCVNKVIPTRTHKEYYADNKEKIDEYKKIYKTEWKKNNPAYDNTYHIEHKESIKERKRLHRLNNIEKVKHKNICVCNGSYTEENKTNHLNTKKHINFINQKNENKIE